MIRTIHHPCCAAIQKTRCWVGIVAVGWVMGFQATPVSRAGEGGDLASVASWDLTIPAAEFDRCEFLDPLAPERIRAINNLSGRPDPRKNPGEKGRGRTVGWVEYDFETPEAGWVEISIDGPAKENQVIINGATSLTPADGGKAGSVWLESGNHTLRLERYKWEGFAPISEVTIRGITGESLGDTVRYRVVGASTVFPKGGELPLQIHAGARTTSGELVAKLTDRATGVIQSEHRIPIEAAQKPLEFRYDLPLTADGIFEVKFFEDDTPIGPDKLAPLLVVVVDTTPVQPSLDEVPRKLVEEIDCVAREPDFSNGEASRITESVAGKYRESGEVGYLKNMNAEDPSWFSYKVRLPDLNGPYLVEVDYPDDALRTTIAQIRQGVPEIGVPDRFPYAIGVGIDSGGEFQLSNTMRTMSVIVWPSGTDWRITMMTPQDGSRAAASKIRIYQVTGPLRPMPGYQPNGRLFTQWYEEGFSYLTNFGGSQNSIPDIVRGTDQWLKTTAYMGANEIITTVAIYQMEMYPSQFNRHFNEPYTFDAVRLILLMSEKYGLDFVAEFAPEAREVAYLAGGAPEDAPNILRNKSGKHPELPHRGYNPAHPLNQEWVLDMLREFVERYQDSPQFKGISLRIMEWANPGLINFHSLEWGYDDFTVGLFAEETGIQIPISNDDPGRFALRSDWIRANKMDEWIKWRQSKVTDLYRRITQMVRSIRPDLVVYTTVFPRPDKWAGMGLDFEKLSQIDGLEVIQALHKYGRRADAMKTQENRDMLINVDHLTSLIDQGADPLFLFNQAYVEATKAVAPNEQLGYPPEAPHGWTSGVANPVGEQILERLAISLAEADALMLGDGGNAYTLGQPETREFLKEFRQLPGVKFTARPEARDPIAVWEAEIGEEFWFYAVNREVYPIPVTIAFRDPSDIVRAVSSTPAQLTDGALSFTLEPYELRVWRAKKGTQIEQVDVEIPADQIAGIRAQVAHIRDLNTRIRDGEVEAPFSPKEREAIQVAATKADAALEQGHLRSARSHLENATLIQVYERLNQYPPGLRALGLERDPDKNRASDGAAGS